MDIFSTINIIQIISPFFIGIGFILFPVMGREDKRLNIYVYCFVNFILSLFALAILVLKKQDLSWGFNIWSEGDLFYQKDMAKFLLISSLGYFFQMKTLEEEEDNFSLKAFFNGIFFSLFNLSIYIGGEVSTYCVLELLVFSVILLGSLNNYLWSRKTLLLQSLGTALILSALIFINEWVKKVGFVGGKRVLENLGGGFTIEELSALLLLLGILLKTAIFEYGERATIGQLQNQKSIDPNKNTPDKMTFYLSIIKLYLPARLFFEMGIFRMIDFEVITKWIIFGFCLINCSMIRSRNIGIEKLQLIRLFSGLIVLGGLILGSEGFDLLLKNSFYLILLFMFFFNVKGDKLNDIFILVLLILSAGWIVSGFYFHPNLGLGEDVLIWNFITAFLTIYLIVKNLWHLLGKKLEAGEDDVPFSFDTVLIRNVIILIVIFILTEFNAEYVLGKSILGIF